MGFSSANKLLAYVVAAVKRRVRNDHIELSSVDVAKSIADQRLAMVDSVEDKILLGGFDGP